MSRDGVVVPEGGGALLVDKPAGPTSHDVVSWARKSLGVRRIGHTGTLDPFASGLLILLVGPVTRLAEYLAVLSKRYEARARLGIRTDTHDAEGKAVAVQDFAVSPSSFKAFLIAYLPTSPANFATPWNPVSMTRLVGFPSAAYFGGPGQNT